MQAKLNRVADWLAAGACIVLVVVMLITFVDVMGRYFFSAPLTFAVEIVELGMGLIVLFGLAVTTLNRGHIAVDLLSGALPPLGNQALKLLASFCGLLFIGLMAWRLFDRALNFMNDGLATQILYLPVFPIVFLMSAAALVAAMIAFVQTIFSNNK